MTMAKGHVELAAQAHTNLTVFHAIKVLLEGGTIHGAYAQKAANRIMKICDAQCQVQLRAYDKERSHG
jgi:hypothetical protein